jgi:transcriptional regulator with PAS, ATPase and Fis domain
MTTITLLDMRVATGSGGLPVSKPFITVNCSAIPENLIESELFGHRKGSFTGALADRIGKFEAANQGTVFLDEIGELPVNLQARLLRVIQEREIDKIGHPKPIPVNVRIIAATNRDLRAQIEDNQFREDLFYRLSVVTIELPPLRKPRDDIPPLIQHFLKKHCERYQLLQPSLTDEALELLSRYDWPGNVRELENVIERMVVLGRADVIRSEDLPAQIRQAKSRVSAINLTLPDQGISLEELEKEILIQALEKHQWNQTRAARYLNISRKTLIYRMEKFGLVAPQENSEMRSVTDAPT